MGWLKSFIWLINPVNGLFRYREYIILRFWIEFGTLNSLNSNSRTPSTTPSTTTSGDARRPERPLRPQQPRQMTRRKRKRSVVEVPPAECAEDHTVAAESKDGSGDNEADTAHALASYEKTHDEDDEEEEHLPMAARLEKYQGRFEQYIPDLRLQLKITPALLKKLGSVLPVGTVQLLKLKFVRDRVIRQRNNKRSGAEGVASSGAARCTRTTGSIFSCVR